jgi:hypothetical protein
MFWVGCCKQPDWIGTLGILCLFEKTESWFGLWCFMLWLGWGSQGNEMPLMIGGGV